MRFPHIIQLSHEAMTARPDCLTQRKMTTKQKRDIYAEVTASILAQLESGKIPWRKPWACGMPRNASTGKNYRGINSFLLSFGPYANPGWLTFRQAKDLGGNVRKGEKSTLVVFWKLWETTEKDGETKKKVPILRHYNVFNVEQCENLPAELYEIEGAQPWQDSDDTARQILAAYIDATDGPDLDHGGNRAVYSPQNDRVTLPHPETFTSRAGYYETAFHEAAHSTGHRARLNRPGITGPIQFGSQEYAKEELIAEMTAAFLCERCGIVQDDHENAAAYCQAWLRPLKNDPKMIIQAAAAAQKAADYITHETPSTQAADENAAAA